MDKNETNGSNDRKKMPKKGRRKRWPKVERKVTTSCKYPQDLSEVSVNWKRLALKLNDSQSKDKNVKKTNNTFAERRQQKKVIETKSDGKTKAKEKNQIWFDGVDNCLIKSSMADMSASNSGQSTDRLVKAKSFTGLTNIVGMDCEMVGTGSDGQHSMLARVSIVNFFGHCVYDKYAKPMEEITDYRTAFSGIRPSDLVNALDFKTVQSEVHQILKNRTVVGHALNNDFKALLLSHPKHRTRDTSRYFRKLFGGRTPALKRLSETVLGVKVQVGEHDSVEDARVAMRLFTMYRKKWEMDLKNNQRKHLKNK